MSHVVSCFLLFAVLPFHHFSLFLIFSILFIFMFLVFFLCFFECFSVFIFSMFSFLFVLAKGASQCEWKHGWVGFCQSRNRNKLNAILACERLLDLEPRTPNPQNLNLETPHEVWPPPCLFTLPRSHLVSSSCSLFSFSSSFGFSFFAFFLLLFRFLCSFVLVFFHLSHCRSSFSLLCDCLSCDVRLTIFPSPSHTLPALTSPRRGTRALPDCFSEKFLGPFPGCFIRRYLGPFPWVFLVVNSAKTLRLPFTPTPLHVVTEILPYLLTCLLSHLFACFYFPVFLLAN